MEIRVRMDIVIRLGIKMARQRLISRRKFTALAATSSVAMAAGCATNPVTGKRQFMLVSEAMEVDLDRKWAPQQFSADYGAVQDSGLNEYLCSLGLGMAAVTYRPAMPYNFRVLNTVVVNGYTMPAGSIGLARGLLLELDDEAQLAAVVGHELGHVNRRHAAERMSKNMLLTSIIAGGAAYLEYKENKYVDLAAGLGMIGANVILCKYSRDDEREADADGMEYMVRSGQNPAGMSGVMRKFMELHKARPSTVDLLFSTHPMSEERYNAAVKRCEEEYGEMAGLPVNRERYMDNTASIRAIKPAIIAMQNGDKMMIKKKYSDAEKQYAAALQVAPSDYAGLLLMAKCLMMQGKNSAALPFSEQAKAVYPEEAQALHVTGMLRMNMADYGRALSEFSTYEERLPGNPNTIFYKGFCHEKMGQRKIAAKEYMRYRSVSPQGEFSSSVNANLIKWGYIAPPPPPPPKG